MTLPLRDDPWCAILLEVPFSPNIPLTIGFLTRFSFSFLDSFRCSTSEISARNYLFLCVVGIFVYLIL